MVASVHGAPSDGDALVATLETDLTQQRGVLQAIDATQAARAARSEIWLRTEQDRDYQEGTGTHRLREAQRQAEREDKDRGGPGPSAKRESRPSSRRRRPSRCGGLG